MGRDKKAFIGKPTPFDKADGRMENNLDEKKDLMRKLALVEEYGYLLEIIDQVLETGDVQQAFKDLSSMALVQVVAIMKDERTKDEVKLKAALEILKSAGHGPVEKKAVLNMNASMTENQIDTAIMSLLGKNVSKKAISQIKAKQNE